MEIDVSGSDLIWAPDLFLQLSPGISTWIFLSVSPSLLVLNQGFQPAFPDDIIFIMWHQHSQGISGSNPWNLFLSLFLALFLKSPCPAFFSLGYFNSTPLYLSILVQATSQNCMLIFCNSYLAGFLISVFHFFVAHSVYHCRLIPKIQTSLCNSVQCFLMVTKFPPVFKVLQISSPSHLLRPGSSPRSSRKHSSFTPLRFRQISVELLTPPLTMFPW